MRSSRARSMRDCAASPPQQNPRRREPAAARRVRRRTSHRRRDRSVHPARKHRQYRRIARADPAAAVLLVPKPLVGGGRIAALGAVADCRARHPRFHRRDVVGCGDRLGRDALRPGCRRRRSAVRLASPRAGEGLDSRAAVQAIAEPSKSMLLGMWTTAATFYGLMFVDFPSLQELGRLVGHSMVVCGLATLFLVPATAAAHTSQACSARSCCPASQRGSTGIERPSSRHRSSRPCCLAPPPRASGSIRHSNGCDRSPMPPRSKRASLPRSACPVKSVSLSLRDAISNDCLRQMKRWPRGSRRSCRLSAWNRRPGCCRRSPLKPTALSASMRRASCLHTCRHRSRGAAVTAGFQPGAFDAFAERCPAIARSESAAHLRRIRVQRISRSHRPIHLPQRRRMDARHLCVSSNARGADGRSDRSSMPSIRRRR